MTARLSLWFSVIGLCLLGLSWAWPSLPVATAGWTPEQAEEHSQASAELHYLSHVHGKEAQAEAGHIEKDSAAAGASRLKAARERYEMSAANLAATRQRISWIATGLRWSGILVLLAGAASYVVSRLIPPH